MTELAIGRVQRPLRVLHFSAHDGQTGAGFAAARLHLGLLARGIDSRLCVAFPRAGLPQSFTPQSTLAGRAELAMRRAASDRLIARCGGDDYVLSTGIAGHDIRRVVRDERPDLVQLHWFGGNSFRLASLRGLDVPVVWRLSDMWPFCGLDHLQPDPLQYTSAPGTLAGTGRIAVSEWVRRRKADVYGTLRDLTLAAPCRWMHAEARRSALLAGRPIERIATGCDTNLFRPRDRASCRDVLGLARDRALVLVGATSMGTRWKGLDLFVAAMARLAAEWGVGEPALEIVAFGADTGALSALNARVPVHHLGAVCDHRLMAALYNAADVVVAPSRMETLANTVLEALACGTPAVAFDIGGMPDMIDHRENGFLATPGDVARLTAGIRWALSRRDDGAVREAARRKVLAEFTTAQEMDRYLALYERLVTRRVGRPALPAA